MKNIMLKTEIMTKYFQNEDENLFDAVTVVDATVQQLIKIHEDESGMSLQIQSSFRFAASMGQDPQEQFQRLHRTHRRPQRLTSSSSDGNSDDDGMMNSDNVEESHVVYYKKEFKKVLQELISRYTEISVQCKEIADPLFKPLFPLKHPADLKEIEALAALFPSSQQPDVEALGNELELVALHLDSVRKKPASFKDMAGIAFALRKAFPIAYLAYKLTNSSHHSGRK